MKEFSYLKLAAIVILLGAGVMSMGILIHNAHASNYVTVKTIKYGLPTPITIPLYGTAINNSESIITIDGTPDPSFIVKFINNAGYINIPRNLTYNDHTLSFSVNNDNYNCYLVIQPWSTKINNGLDIILNKDTEDLTHVLTCSLVNASSNQPIPGANISFNLNNKNLSTTTDEYGNAYFDFSSLDIGNYTGRIEYNGNNSFGSALATMNVEIDGAVPFDTAINIDTYYYFNANNSTNAKIGQLQANINGTNQSLVDKNVTLVTFNSTGETGRFTGITDSNGFCTFNISSLPVGDYEAFITFIGDSITYYGCTTPDFKIHMDEAPTPPEPTPTPNNDTNTTNDTNSTVNPNTNNINGAADILKPLEDTLPVTGIPVIVGLLACIASILIIKRK
ncbi:MAG: conserved hypothetical protein partial [Methanobrevibacter sp. CfCl-M3]